MLLGTIPNLTFCGATGRKMEAGENLGEKKRILTAAVGCRGQHDPHPIQKRRDPGVRGRGSPRIGHGAARCFTVLLKDSFAGYKRSVIDRYFFFVLLDYPFHTFQFLLLDFLLCMGHTCQFLSVPYNFENEAFSVIYCSNSGY